MVEEVDKFSDSSYLLIVDKIRYILDTLSISAYHHRRLYIGAILSIKIYLSFFSYHIKAAVTSESYYSK